MLDTEIYSQLREKLLKRRKDILSNRRSFEKSWNRLNQSEIEPEETAANLSTSRPLESLADRQQSELQQIDNALSKIDKETFGKCEICRQPISVKRLYAKPWARHCIRCAKSRQGFTTEKISENPVKMNDEALSDDEMIEAIQDEISRAEDIDSEELTIDCRDGVVFLNGVVPAESTRDMLHHLIEDILDFNEVVDNLTIDRTAWERRDRTEDQQPTAKTDAEYLAEGEDKPVNVEKSFDTGEPLTPPDKLEPEKH
ncbi:MAG: TraR/DksA C4-type zinc finger protein [Desulfobacterales bacterium]